MLHLFKNLGIALAGTALVSLLSLTPALAQGSYPGSYMGGYMAGGSRSYAMPYMAPKAPGYGITGGYGMRNGYGPGNSYSPQNGYGSQNRYGSYGMRYSNRYGDDNCYCNRYGMGYGHGYGMGYGYGNNSYAATYYRVVFGDTLSRIAARFGTSVQAILMANPGISNANVIYAGQILAIPAGYGRSYGSSGNYSSSGGYAAPGTSSGGYATPGAQSNNMPGMSTGNVPAASTPTPNAAAAPGQQTANVDLTAQNVAFSTSTITVPAGAHVVVHFTNKDPMPHSFAVFTDSSAAQVIFRGKVITGPNASTTYEFDAPSQPGTYFFHCDVHPSQMTGQFVVK